MGSNPTPHTSELHRKVQMKRFNAAKEGLAFYLSCNEVKKLLDLAGITVDDWCLRGFHLSRINDEGDYSLGNCRFISAIENYRERKVSDRWRQAASQTLRKVNESMSRETRQHLAKLGGEASALSPLSPFYRDPNRIDKPKHPSYAGSKNSQYGTYWITKDSVNRKIHVEDLQIFLTLGWHRGRKATWRHSPPKNPRWKQLPKTN